MTTPKNPTPGELARELRIRINSNLAKGNNAQGLMLYCYNNATAIADALAQLTERERELGEVRAQLAAVQGERDAEWCKRIGEALHENMTESYPINIDDAFAQVEKEAQERHELSYRDVENDRVIGDLRATIEELRFQLADWQRSARLFETERDTARRQLTEARESAAKGERSNKEMRDGLADIAEHGATSEKWVAQQALKYADASLAPRAEVGEESKPLTVDDLEIGKGHVIRWIGPRPTPGDPDNAND